MRKAINRSVLVVISRQPYTIGAASTVAANSFAEGAQSILSTIICEKMVKSLINR